MDVLRIRFHPDNEWLGQLRVCASIGEFSAIGEAWFNKDDLREFAQSMVAFPLQKDRAPSITGGHDGNGDIQPQKLVTMGFEPHGVQGAIKATIHLESENWNGSDRDLHSQATIRFLVTYGDLSRFGPALLDLLDGRLEEAVLTSTP